MSSCITVEFSELIGISHTLVWSVFVTQNAMTYLSMPRQL